MFSYVLSFKLDVDKKNVDENIDIFVSICF